VFVNRVLRRIFGPKRDEVTGEWRKFRNVELHNLYSSPNIMHMNSKRMRWAGHVARMGEENKLFKILVGKHEEKRPLGKPRRRWEEHIASMIVHVIDRSVSILIWGSVLTFCWRGKEYLQKPQS
jgi:hypothetical protein